MRSLSMVDPLLDGVHWVKGASSCSSVYLLENGKTLIDAGNMFGLMDDVITLIAPECIERILFTHGHYDHVGGVEEIYQAASPDIYIHTLARDHLGLLREPFPAFFDLLERDGKVILVGESDWIETAPRLRVLHLPGHTAGDLCFFDERSGALFSGDTLLPRQGSMGAASFETDEELGGSLEGLAASLRRLLSLPVRHLLPGHGEPVFNRGADEIKIALYSLYRARWEDRPELAWVAMGGDLLAAGLEDEAYQCAAKAEGLAPESKEVQAFKSFVETGAR